MKMPEYNTARPPLRIREYGRNVYRLVTQAMQIDDRKKRTKRAYDIVKLMAQLNPEVKDTAEQRQKLWDHLFLMSDFKLDVDAPYPMPEKDYLKQKPTRMKYPQSRIKFRYYGKNVESMIRVAKEIEDPEQKREFVNYLASYMKLAYLQFNDEKVSDDVIKHHLYEMSGKTLQADNIIALVKPGEHKQHTKFSGGKSKNKNQQRKKKQNRRKDNRGDQRPGNQKQ